MRGEVVECLVGGWSGVKWSLLAAGNYWCCSGLCSCQKFFSLRDASLLSEKWSLCGCGVSEGAASALGLCDSNLGEIRASIPQPHCRMLQENPNTFPTVYGQVLSLVWDAVLCSLRCDSHWHLEWKIPYLSPLTPYKISNPVPWVSVCGSGNHQTENFALEECLHIRIRLLLEQIPFISHLELCFILSWHSPTCPVHRQLPPCLPKMSEAVRNAKWSKSEANKITKFGVTHTTLSFAQRRLKNDVEVVNFKNN